MIRKRPPIFWILLAVLCRWVLCLRYRIEVRGMELVAPEKLNSKQGILFLPNHPAQIEGLFLYVYFWPKFQMRPLTVEYTYRLGFLRPFIKLIRAIPIPDFNTSVNQLKIKKANDAMATVVGSLKSGDSVLLYPAGNMKTGGKEIIGGASSAHALIQECPDVNLVLIRTSGLWGSSFSKALIGQAPDLGQMCLEGIKTVFKNLIFFTPRRKVIIELEMNPSDFPRGGSRVEINRYLENWYNSYPDEQGNRAESEPLKLVRYKFWSQELPEVFQTKKKMIAGDVEVSEETRQNIYHEISRILDTPSLRIEPGMSLSYDLGMDSLNIADLGAYLLKNYELEQSQIEQLETVQDVLDIAGGAKLIDSSIPQVGVFHWPDEKGRPEPFLPEGKTLPEAFLATCERMGSFSCAGDDLSGVLNYQKMKRAVCVLAEYFRTIPEDHIAVMLPASVGTFVTILAIQFAKKIPVMLNWTLGPRYLEEMMRITGAKKVITSWRFIDRLSHVDFGSLIDQMQLLEDIRQGLSFKMKLRGAFLARKKASSVLKAFNLRDLDRNSTCVILFTSGTEAAPKCVPLSHENLLSTIRLSFDALEDLRSSDCAYIILPPFHSFGLIVTGMLSLLTGVKTAFYPDPTNSAALAEGIERWKVSLFPAPPSFLKRLFNLAKAEQLKGIRIFISGAEKMPQEVLNRIASSGAKYLEGYGITECSSTVALTRPSIPQKGVGILIPHYEFCTIHLETRELLPSGAEGEICLRGPSVFKGYIGSNRSPFIEIQGKSWYRTGDIGRIDKEGNVYLSGRLKRFTKMGGEMISLGAVEEVLIKELIEKGKISPDIHSLAVCADERTEGSSKLILLTTISIDKETANEILRKAGFSNLIKISVVKKVDEIPILATGKMDYRKLQAFLNENLVAN